MKFAGTAILSCALLQSTLAAVQSASERFYDAIRADDKRAVQQLLESGGDVNSRDNRANTPLMYAAGVGSTAMMRQLIAAGADVNAKNSFEATALMWGADQPEKVRLLVDK